MPAVTGCLPPPPPGCFACKTRPESSLDCLVCAKLDRQNTTRQKNITERHKTVLCVPNSLKSGTHLVSLVTLEQGLAQRVACRRPPQGVLPESQGQNQALTVVCVPSSTDRTQPAKTKSQRDTRLSCVCQVRSNAERTWSILVIVR